VLDREAGAACAEEVDDKFEKVLPVRLRAAENRDRLRVLEQLRIEVRLCACRCEQQPHDFSAVRIRRQVRHRDDERLNPQNARARHQGRRRLVAAKRHCTGENRHGGRGRAERVGRRRGGSDRRRARRADHRAIARHSRGKRSRRCIVRAFATWVANRRKHREWSALMATEVLGRRRRRLRGVIVVGRFGIESSPRICPYANCRLGRRQSATLRDAARRADNCALARIGLGCAAQTMKIEDWMETKLSCCYGAQTSLMRRPLFFFAQLPNGKKKRKKRKQRSRRRPNSRNRSDRIDASNRIANMEYEFYRIGTKNASKSIEWLIDFEL
jgi:hypothetical protein